MTTVQKCIFGHIILQRRQNSVELSLANKKISNQDNVGAVSEIN